MSKPAGKCIFCQGGRLSKEHIFAEWMQDYLPVDLPYTSHEITRPDILGNPNRIPIPKSYRPLKQGDPLVWKLRRVCRSCNGGWMSRLQKRAKPIVGPLLQGDWSGLTVEKQEVLTAWIAMLVMVYEFADPNAVVITSGERHRFMEEQLPDDHWWIAVGLLAQPHKVIRHQTNYAGSAEGFDPQNLEANVQFTRVGIGKLLFQALSSRNVVVQIPGETTFRMGLTPIWPPNGYAARPIRPLATSELNDALYSTEWIKPFLYH